MSIIASFALSINLHAQDAILTLSTQPTNQIIPAEIYGQFSEHLGSCIYGGIWVGPESDIPNTDGYRNDVVNALRELQVPVLRWPGGCFADDYHWMDGIGPKEQRTKICNNNWGGDLEDNSFGTHEFLNLCEMIGCEPYISGNVGSGTPEELAKWVEYMTSNSQSSVVNMRRQNGRDKAWDVRYLGIGNEAWGCGGNMTPEYYSDLFRRYTTYTRNYNGRLYKIASGASDSDYNWTEVLMKNIGTRMDALAVHYYTVPQDWTHHGSATDFSTDEYLTTLSKSLAIDGIIAGHIAIMDKYDPERKVDLLVDEWGTWYDVEPGTNPGHLFQQSTMRDALVAALSLNIFHKYCYRVKMANIAQVVNVLQSMILTDGPRMLLTPTYHAFRLYAVHQNAEWLPIEFTKNKVLQGGDQSFSEVPSIDATASRKDGLTHLTICNTDWKNSRQILVQIEPNTDDSMSHKANRVPSCQVLSAQVLTAKDVHTTNTFDHPSTISPVPFHDYKIQPSSILLTLPPCSIVALELK